jgi:hypothetical protein
MSDETVVIELATTVVEVSSGAQGPAGPGVNITATPPASGNQGDWWIDEDTLQLFVY